MVCDGSGCPAPTWDDFKAHLFYCTGSWMLLLCLGLVAASVRHLWDVERVVWLLQPIALILKEDKYYKIVMAFASLMMCFFYISYVEGDNVPGGSKMFEEIACYIHGFEVLVLLIFTCAQSPDDLLAFGTSRLFSDCLVVVSILIRGKKAGGDSYFSFSFAAALRIRNLWLEYDGMLSSLDTSVGVKLCSEGVKLISRIFVFAAMMHQLESFKGEAWMSQDWESWDTATSPTEVWTTSSSIYLVLCTLSTVGYGDVQPRSIIGQVLLMIIIVVGLGFMVKTVVALMEVAQHSKGGGGEYRIGVAGRMRRHIVICGNPCAQTLEDLLEELYHDDHMATATYLDVVILLPPVGSEGLMNRIHRFLHLQENRKILGKVFMLQGSPLLRQDLERTKLGAASLAYVLPNINSRDAEREDLENAMRALSMHRFAPYVRLVAMLLKVEFREMMLSTGLTPKDVVCMDEMKLSIMGKTCEAQGFLTMACNLFKSSGEYAEGDGEGDAWMADYKRGMGNEIYETRLNACYRGAPFGEVAIDILTRSDAKAYLIGVIDESRYPGEEPVIRMHPGRQFRMGTDENFILKGIFIAPDLEVIQQHPPDKPFSWHLDKTGSEGVSGAREGVPSGPNLPNAMPEPGEPKDILEQMAQRWLLDKRVVKRERQEHTNKLMGNAAETRTVQGLKNMAHMPVHEVEDIMELRVREDMWKTQSFSALEDGAEEATDPKQKALLQQQLKAARSQEQEKQKEMADARNKAEIRIRRMVENVTLKAELLDKEETEDLHKKNEKEMDTELWGGPQSPRKPLWGTPMEPPASLIMRGEHIVMIALEGNEDSMAAGSQDMHIESAGRKLGLQHFMRALRAEVPVYAQRPVVVLAQRVPYDWPTVAAQYKDVYLITGRPLEEESMRQAGLQYAKAVLIYQSGQVTSADPTLVDTQAIFGTALAESLLRREHKDVLCIVDLNLDDNSYFVSREDTVETPFHADEMDMKKARALLEKTQTPYADTKRYMSGQMFASQKALTSLMANVLYNPALGSLVLEMMHMRFVVVPMPKEFKGTTFKELYQYMMRRRNLVPIALLRKFEDSVIGDYEEEEKAVEPQIRLAGYVEEVVARYSPKEPPGDRFVYTMPSGDRPVVARDGVMCVVPRGDNMAFLE